MCGEKMAPGNQPPSPHTLVGAFKLGSDQQFHGFFEYFFNNCRNNYLKLRKMSVSLTISSKRNIECSKYGRLHSYIEAAKLSSCKQIYLMDFDHVYLRQTTQIFTLLNSFRITKIMTIGIFATMQVCVLTTVVDCAP